MATETTSTSAGAWAMDVKGFAAAEAIPEALVLQTSTVAGFVEGDEPAVRVPYVDDADAGFVSEGASIDEADPDMAECLVHTGKIAQLVRLSREQFGHAGTSDLLADSVRRAVTVAANKAYIQQAAPTSPEVTPPAGLLNVAGIVDGGEVAGDLDALSDTVATIEANGAVPSSIIAAPDALGFLRKFKTDSTSNLSLLGAGTNDMQRALLGIPLVVSAAVPSGTMLVVDKTAVVSAVGQVQVMRSEHVYFASDSVGLRCTFRFGQNAVRPERIAKVTVADPDAA